jgi:alpha-tubulin suppressor-like RCC1 family protein
MTHLVGSIEPIYTDSMGWVDRLIDSVRLGLLLSIVASGCKQEFSVLRIPQEAKLEFGIESSSSSLSTMLLGSWRSVQELEMGRTPLGSNIKTVVQIKNIGERTASIQSIQMLQSEAPESMKIQSRCPASLAPLETCSIDLEFKPENVGNVLANLKVDYDNGKTGSDSTAIPVKATANNLAFLSLEEESLVIASNTVGYTLGAIFKVLYNGSQYAKKGITLLPARGVSFFSDPNMTEFSIDASKSTCGDVIQNDCYIAVNFTPKSVGTRVSQLSINYFNGAEALKITGSVTGTGVAQTQLATLAASNLNIGPVVANPVQPRVANLNINFTGSVAATSVTIGSLPTPFTVITDPKQSTCMGGVITSNCVIAISFQPAALGSFSAPLVIQYQSNGQQRPQLSVNVSGQGVRPAAIRLSSSSVPFDTSPAFKSLSKAVTLTNDGDLPVSGSTAVVATNTVDFSSSRADSCLSLAPGSSCTFTINYRPKSSGAHQSDFSWSYFDGRAVQTILIKASGAGTAPLVLEGGGTINFGNVMLGHPSPPSRSMNVGVFGLTTLTNASQLTFSPAALASPFEYGAHGCKAPLDPRTSNACSVVVRVPSTTGHVLDTQFSQSFKLDYTGDGGQGSGSLSYTVRATFRAPPVLAFESSSVVLPTVSARGESRVQVILRNLSPYFSVTGKQFTVQGSGVQVVSHDCARSIAASGSCTATLGFSSAQIGKFSGSLQFSYSDQIADRVATQSWTAESSGRVTLTASATSIDFGSVFVGDVIPERAIDVSVLGSDPWSFAHSLAAPFSARFESCGSTSACKIWIKYDPQVAATDQIQAKFSYSPGLPSPSELNINLIGKAAVRSATIAFNRREFKKTLLGETSTLRLEVRNSGTTASAPIQFALEGAAAPEIVLVADTLADTCQAGQVLNPNQICRLSLEFKPSQIGTKTGKLNVVQGGTTSTTTLTGVGTQRIQVFAGGYQTCIVDELARLLCWGKNNSGQLGQGHLNAITAKPQTMTPINFGSGVVVQSVSVGDSHTCAVVRQGTQNGLLSCWGSNELGKLGLGLADSVLSSPRDASGQLRVVNVGTGEEVLHVSAGFEHTCAVLKSGKLKCWGGNSSGQLGYDHKNAIGTQVAEMGDALKAVALGLAAQWVSAGAGHTCAVMTGGKTKCWGDNFYGQLGQGRDVASLGGSSGDMATLAAISLASNFEAQTIYASAGAATCAKTVAGVVKCFGKTSADEKTNQPFWGVLGNCFARETYTSTYQLCSVASTLPPTPSVGHLSADMGNVLPVVQWGSNVSQIEMGRSHVCSVDADGKMKCFGHQSRGQLGTGDAISLGAAPDKMGSNLKVVSENVADIATGYEHTCLVLKDNTVKCWGVGNANATGLAGFGITTDTGNSLSTIPSALPVVYDGR